MMLYSVGAFDGERPDKISPEQPHTSRGDDQGQWKSSTKR